MRCLRATIAAALLCVFGVAAPAVAQGDEIQVYDGGLADPGVFNLTWHNNFTPKRIKSPAFPGGITGHMVTSMADHETFQTLLRVEGQDGTLIVHNPLAPHNGHELVLQRRGEDHSEKVAGDSTYRHQLVAFVDAVRTGKRLPTMGADSIHNMRLIDAVYRAAGLPVRGEQH